MEGRNRTQQRQGRPVAHGRFAFIGGRLALDFANTLGGLRGGATRELVATYADLVAWGEQAGVIAPDEEQRLVRAAQLDSTAAMLVLERAKQLREAIYAVVVAQMRGDTPRSADLATLNRELAQALAHRRVTTGATGVVWTWVWRVEGVTGGESRATIALDAVLWPVVVAAADLLTMEDQPLLRQCASDACSWLYLDTTRNHSRRWCDMKGCGNKAKVRRYRQRQAE